MSNKEVYDTQKYWEHRLSNRIDLRGTGHRAFDWEYNRWFYQAQSDSLRLLLTRNQIQLKGKSAIDIGSGNGFYVDFLLKHGINSITGMDITQASVDYLQLEFAKWNFVKVDISGPDTNLNAEFDIVTAISVLFHIVEEEKFSQAIHNIGALIRPGGFVVLSDTFSKSILNLTPHVRFRSKNRYEQEFREVGLNVIDVLPICYFLNFTFIPILGPRLLSFIKAGKFLYKLDSYLREKGLSNWNGSKFLLAQKNH